FLTWCSSNFKAVVYVPGNHEYWHSPYSIKETDKYLESLCYKHNVIYGQKRIIQLKYGAPVLICCTLWSQMDKNLRNVKNGDFTMIKGLNYQTRSNLHYD